MKWVPQGKGSVDWIKWRRDATDEERAPFQAKRAREFIEIYRYLARHKGWHPLREIADAVGMITTDKQRYRQLRRCLLVLKAAGYVEMCIVWPDRIGSPEPHGTMARIKVER